MKRLLLLGAAMSLAMVAGASAADMAPMYTKAPPPPPMWSWTGCYLGGGATYDLWNQDNSMTDTGLGITAGNWTAGGRGWFGTVQGGCDYQLASTWVVGAFADGNWGSARGDLALANTNLVGSEKMSSSWAAGGRLGYLPFDKLMVYLSGGWTQAHFQGVNFNLASTGAATTLFINNQDYNGAFLGSGYEYSFNWLPGIFWKSEYRYSWFGSKDIPLLTTGGALAGETIHAKKQVQEIRSELVWRFNWR